MDIKVIWQSGDISTYKTTFLSHPDGYLIENDYLHLSIEDIEKNGLIIDRAAHIYDLDEAEPNQEQPSLPKLIQSNNLIIPPEKVDDILAIELDGTLVIQRTQEGLINLALDTFLHRTEDTEAIDFDDKEPI